MPSKENYYCISCQEIGVKQIATVDLILCDDCFYQQQVGMTNSKPKLNQKLKKEPESKSKQTQKKEPDPKQKQKKEPETKQKP